jgi:hypothetical protein
MSRAKKTKPNPSTSPEDLSIYLRDSSLIPRFNKYRALDIFPGRYVNFGDFGEFQLHNYFKNAGLYELCSHDSLVPYYPSLIYLFYTNIQVDETITRGKVILSLVKGMKLRLTPTMLEDILHIPNTGIPLHNVVMNDRDILNNHIFLPGKSLPMQNNKLRPLPRLVCRILAYNLIPKTGSFDYISSELAVATYAIMANIKVNWAMVVFENLQRVPSTFHPFGCMLTRIFTHFKVDLASEKVMISFNEIIDRTTYARMKLGAIQTSDSQDDDPASTSAPPTSTSSRPSRPSVNESLHILTLQVEGLATGQGKILKNQEVIFKGLKDINQKVDTLADMMRGHFFPPPPPPSSA